MLQKYFLYALIALIALQSVDAMADAVKFHQVGSEYSESDYFSNKLFIASPQKSLNERGEQASIDTAPLTDQEQASADHCCYCHGISNMLFSNSDIQVTPLSADKKITCRNLGYNSQLITPDLRPPIANT